MLLLLLLPAAALAQGTTFNYAGSAFQTYVVPASGWYLLDVQGAQGGPASNLSHQGGKGARMQGYVYLQQGALLRIAVGGEGGRGQGDGNNVSGGGGGGGSSVAVPSGSVGTPSPSDVMLLMAGGGGGAAANYNGLSGLEFEAGGLPNGGVYGHGAGVGSSEWGGAGGAGYRTNGGTHYSCSCASAELLSTGGQAYLNGNHGGVSSVACSFCGRGGAGGWGGGGEGGPAWSGLFSQVDGGGGGGGGYSGGGGGARQGDGAGGGGSYVSSTVDTTLCLAVRGYRSGHGLVQITPVSGPPVVQQPANQQVAIGQAVTLGPVFDDPSGQTTYAWMKDGVVLADQTSATLTIASFQSTDSGCYQAIVKQASAMCITLPAFVSPSTSLATLQGWGSNTAGELGLGDTIDLVYSPVQLTSGVVTMAGGAGFSYFVKTDGTLWSMGGNSTGQLGLGDTTDRTAPAQVTTGVVAVAAGLGHTLFVKSDGTLWSTGTNLYGQLGLGDTTARLAPAQVTTGVVAVAAGGTHSLFVKRDGTLWCMGDNASGQLGLGNNTDRNAPMQVASGVVAVAAGRFHTLFLKRDGTVWSTGMGDEGQLGLLGYSGVTSPQQVTEQLNNDVVSVAAGYKHSLLVKRDGTLLGTGRNRSGELGLGVSVLSTSVPYTIDSDVVAAVGGDRYSLFVKSDGTLWSMGDNYYGQLGTGCSTCSQRLNQVYFRNSTNQPTTPIVVATLPKMPTAAASLVTAAPALSTVQASQGGVSIGQFALALRDVPSGQYREAIADDPSTGWSADAIYWNNQNQIRFAVRFRNSAGTNDITAFGAFTLDDPSEAEFLALRTADLRRIGIQPSANASNQARYLAFQSLMNSATLEQLRARFGGFLPDLDIGFAW